MNISGIGTDIVDVERMSSKLGREGFLATAFTTAEIAYCQSKKNSAECFAARFAAKEAYMKALGTGWSQDAEFLEIEIQNSKSGAPTLILSGKTKAHFENSNLKDIFVSLSHTKTSAVAFVILTLKAK